MVGFVIVIFLTAMVVVLADVTPRIIRGEIVLFKKRGKR